MSQQVKAPGATLGLVAASIGLVVIFIAMGLTVDVTETPATHQNTFAAQGFAQDIIRP